MYEIGDFVKFQYCFDSKVGVVVSKRDWGHCVTYGLATEFGGQAKYTGTALSIKGRATEAEFVAANTPNLSAFNEAMKSQVEAALKPGYRWAWVPTTPPAPTADVEALTAALFRVLNEEEIRRRAELKADPSDTYGVDPVDSEKRFERTARKMRSLRLDLDAQARNMAGKLFDYLQRGAK